MWKGWRYTGIVLVSFFLFSCQQEILEIEDSPEPPVKTDQIPVTFLLSANAGFENKTDVIPMAQGEEDNITRTLLAYKVKTIVAKKIDTRWIIDTVQEFEVLKKPSKWETTVNYKDTTHFLPFTLELRPGQYRMTVFANPSIGKWDPELKPGTLIEDEEALDQGVHPAFYYMISTHPNNTGCLTLGRREVFTGSVDFEVKKTEDLYSSYENTHSVLLTRKNGCFRIVLKDNPKLNFVDTETTIYSTLRVRGGKHFPQGIDVWGKPWYDRNNYCDTIKLITMFRRLQGTEYLISSYTGLTVFEPFYITDESEEGIEFEMENTYLTGQSGYPFQYYIFKEKPSIVKRLQNNYITSLVLQLTGETFENGTPPEREKGTYIQVIEEDPVSMFGEYMEWNLFYGG